MESNKNSLADNVIRELSPEHPLVTFMDKPQDVELEDLTLTIILETGQPILCYSPEKDEDREFPEPAKASPDPSEISTINELYLTGLHPEQYRHATFDPGPYYLEALRRDPYDVKCNNAYGY